MHSQDAESRLLRTAWGLAAPAARGPRPRFSWQEVAAAGVDLADSEGLSRVSLSAVAARLGLTTTALYRYVDSKEALVELMLDAAVGPPPELADDDWRTAADAWARALWRQYRQHPWLTDVRPTGMPRYPQRLGWIDVLLPHLDRGQVRSPMTTALLLDSVARTFALLARPTDATSTPPTWLLDAAAAAYPRLAEELDRDWNNIDDEFSDAVRTVIRGSVQDSS